MTLVGTFINLYSTITVINMIIPDMLIDLEIAPAFAREWKRIVGPNLSFSVMMMICLTILNDYDSFKTT